MRTRYLKNLDKVYLKALRSMYLANDKFGPSS